MSMDIETLISLIIKMFHKKVKILNNVNTNELKFDKCPSHTQENPHIRYECCAQTKSSKHHDVPLQHVNKSNSVPE